jgi:hypothetical protein
VFFPCSVGGEGHNECPAFVERRTTVCTQPQERASRSRLALCARLHDHADGIVNVAAHEMEQDIRLATRALALFATLKFRIAEITEMALSQPGPAIARDLRDALDDAQG